MSYSIEVTMQMGNACFTCMCQTASEALDAVCSAYSAVNGASMTHAAREEWMGKLLGIRMGRLIKTEAYGLTVCRAG